MCRIVHARNCSHFDTFMDITAQMFAAGRTSAPARMALHPESLRKPAPLPPRRPCPPDLGHRRATLCRPGASCFLAVAQAIRDLLGFSPACRSNAEWERRSVWNEHWHLRTSRDDQQIAAQILRIDRPTVRNSEEQVVVAPRSGVRCGSLRSCSAQRMC
jgi:hypothetical protein